jgi:hypothetical protein
MGDGLESLNMYDTITSKTGRASGWHAVVRQGATVNANLGMDSFGKTTALFKLAEIQNQGTSDEYLLGEASFEGALEKISAAIPQEHEHAYGAHMLAKRPWIIETGAMATLGLDGKAGIVAEPVVDDTGSTATQYYVMVTISSQVFGDQADGHHSIAAVNQRTYGELMNEAFGEYAGTTSDKVFGADTRGRSHVEKVMERAAVRAAEAIGAALGLEFEKKKWDTLANDSRPEPAVINTTNFMRPGVAGTVEIFCETIPVSGAFVYDFGGVSSMAFVHNTSRPVVSVRAAPAEVTPTFGLDYGSRSTKEKMAVDQEFTWEGKVEGIGSAILASSSDGFKSRYSAAKAVWGGDTSILMNKRMKVTGNDPRDQPVVPGDLL